MFAVPEVDDNTDVSSSIENTKPSIEFEVTKESVSSPEPLLTSSEPMSTKEREEKVSIRPEVSPPPPPPPPPLPPSQSVAASQQHRSRLSLFHRNTIHVCDQIVDRV
ncbi:unnamed protein product [Rotaria magnacalcarata]|nr:unnamed protein product [Rotaria magnacalcarata]